MLELIPNEYVTIKAGVRYICSALASLSSTVQYFFGHDDIALEVICATMIIGEYHGNDNLKDLALDLVVKLHLQNSTRSNLEHLLSEQEFAPVSWRVGVFSR